MRANVERPSIPGSVVEVDLLASILVVGARVCFARVLWLLDGSMPARLTSNPAVRWVNPELVAKVSYLAGAQYLATGP